MNIKYYSNPEKQETIAVLHGTEFSCINKIDKILANHGMFVNSNKYIMPTKFRAKVKCHPDDVFSEVEGCKQAKRKLLKAYYKALDKRMDVFRAELIQVNSKIFETKFSETP